MDERTGEYGCDSTEPAEKLEELVALLKPYQPRVHTCQEEGYAYLGENDACITLTNRSGEELYIDLEDEFTLSYQAWHSHYSSSEEDYETLKKELLELLNNRRCSCSVFIQDRWIGSAALNPPPSSQTEVRQFLRRLLKLNKGWEQQARGEGVEVRMAYWDQRKNQTVRLAPGEYGSGAGAFPPGKDVRK